jgi:cytochrome d ubiquinol oxidase subunit I
VAVTFAVGAVTGIVISFEFGLLWPEFTGTFGKVFGVLFAVEGIFFFLEAIFVAIYIFGWKRPSPWAHFRAGVPIPICGIGGAFSVVAVNSWMNQPQGWLVAPAMALLFTLAQRGMVEETARPARRDAT